MSTAKRLFEDIQAKGLSSHCLFRFPYLHLIVVAAQFVSRSDEDRRALFAELINWTPEAIDATLLAANLELELLTPAEHAEGSSPAQERGQGWLRDVVSDIAPGMVAPAAAQLQVIPTLHFYGYKGGQARSTCLGHVARTLANDNWRVLVVDCDLEAPSLDILFDQRELALPSTLLGVNSGAEIRPRRVYDPDIGTGCVDLIACRPDGPEYALESIALAMGLAMDPGQLVRCMQRIVVHAKDAGHHVLLIDHRAGLSPFVIPSTEALPGQLVIFARLDEQWRAARAYLPALLQRSLDRSAVFIAFRGDSEAPDVFLDRTQLQVEELLTILARVKGQFLGTTELGPGDLRPHFLVWPFDPSFRQSRLPDPQRTTPELRNVVYELRRLTGVEGQPTTPGLSRSGAQDRGGFVQTALWRELMRPDVPTRYIFGRKGTGKTRLLTEMQKRGLGEPLLVDRQDQSSFGLPAGSRALSSAVERFNLDPGAFFWMLFGCAIGLSDTARYSLQGAIMDALSQGTDRTLSMQRVYDNARGKTRRTFLIDGLETAFPSDKLSRFIEHLFRTLWELHGDRELKGLIEFRVFLRTDLATFGIQNFEQHVEGQVAHLRWDYQSILNFALLRMLATESEPMGFYALHMPAVIKEIEANRELLSHGALPIDACENLLLRIFPKKIPRNNTLTTNFLRTYFTDTDAPILSLSGGAGDSGATYYPRVFDAFVEAIGAAACERGSAALIEGRIDPSIMLSAHEKAADLFLDQVRQELDFRIALSPDEEQNRRDIKKLLDAFQGETTPFVPGSLAQRIAQKLGPGELTPVKIQEALTQMRDIGMFENRPGAPSEWRVGRLFKSSLRMRYQR